MANGYDGDIKLSVSLSPEEVQQSARKLQKEIEGIFNKTSGQNLDSSFQKLLSNMSKAASRSDALQKSLEKVSNTQIQTKEYTKLENTISSLESKIESAKVKQAQFLEGGGKESSRTFENMNSNIAMLEDKLFDAQRALQTLVDEGKQFTLNEDGIERAKNALADNNNQLRLMLENVAQYQNSMSESSQENSERVMSAWERVGELFKRIKDDILHPIQAIQRLRENSDDAGKSAEQTASKFSRLASVVSKIGSILGRAGSALKTLAQRFLHTGSASRGFDLNLKKGIMTILKYGLGIRSLYVLFRRIRSAITESLTTMAQMNGGVNQTNSAISALVSSLNYLKGSLGAAFAPILTVVSPILSSFIDQIAGVITAIGMMIAKLTGAKSYFRATKVSTNYAASKASGGSSSSKKSAEEKYQEAVEKAQKKYDEQVAKTQEKNAKAAAKAEEQQAKAAEKLAKSQEKANRKLADFDDLNVLNIEDLEELEEIEADVYDEPELELPDREDFQDALSGGGGGDPFGLEEIPLDDWEWNWDDLLKKARELGEKLAEFLNDIFKDEELAKKIGNTIGNLINLAINFAYGFISTFDFHQFGRWLGTLIQEGIETIDWGLLGETIGKGLNGIADTVIGFFETYNVGTLGSSIAKMFNRAIDAVDPKLIGEAVLDLLQAPLIELTTFLTETNIRAAGEKFGEFFHRVFTEEGLNDQTLGETLGNLLETAVNAAIDFLIGLGLDERIVDLTVFFEDLFGNALDGVHWDGVFKVILDVFNGLITSIMILFADLGNKLATALGQEEWFPQSEIDLMKEGWISAFDYMSGSVDNFINTLKRIDEGEVFTAQELAMLQQSFGLTDEQVDKLIKKMKEVNPNLDTASLGLQNYSGSWETFTADIGGDIDEVIRKTGELSDTSRADFVLVGDSIKQLPTLDEWQEKIKAGGDAYKETVDGIKTNTEDIGKSTEEVTEKTRGFIPAIQEFAQAHIDAWSQMFEQIEQGPSALDILKEGWGRLSEKVDEGTASLVSGIKEFLFGTEEAKTAIEEVGVATDETDVKVDTATTNAVDKTKMLWDPLYWLQQKVEGVGEATDKVTETTTTSTRTQKENWEGLSNTVSATGTLINDTANSANNAITTSTQNASNYNTSVITALDGVQAKFNEVSLNFEGFTEAIQLTLEGLTITIDTWYQEMVLQYFSYDAWLLMLQEGPLLALTDFFPLLLTEFDTQMQTWWDTHLLPWFADTKWQTAIYTPWFTFLKTKWKNLLKWWDDEAIKPWWEKHLLVWFKDDKWQTDIYTPWFNYLSTTKWTNLMTWWDTSMKDWWDNKVVPWFEQEKWEKEFDHVYDAAEKIGEKTRDKIKELAEETEDAVHEACINMKGWIEDVIDQLREAIALAQQLQAISRSGGGGGSSSSSSGSSGGGSNSGGGSGGRSFMPMLNIMHFEDNLGMSAFKFPELATGAVIPPNNEFLAILGDQRNGMNIETPLSTMLEAFRSVMDEYMGGSHQSAIMEVDGETFARLMMPHMVDEMHRLGYNTEIIEGI